jgi:transposase
VLAAALDANREMARPAAVLGEENARLRAKNAEQAAELGRVRADLAVLQRMVFGRSSERATRSRRDRAGRGTCTPTRRPGGSSG